MAELGATPEKYGLKVRTHPDGMIITALNKMRNSEIREVTFAGKLVQITRYYKDSVCNQKNIQFTEKWLLSLGTPTPPSTETKNNYLWSGISPALIVEFLQNITIHSSCTNASPKVLADYIISQNEDGELINWTVALVSTNKGAPYSYGKNLPIGLSWRSDDVDNRSTTDKDEENTVYLIRNNLRTESDEEVDLSNDEKAEALKKTIANWTPDGRSPTQPKEASPKYIRQCRKKTNALLLIYTFESGKLDSDGKIIERYDNKYLGYAISFPDSDTAKPVEYKVDEVFLRNELDE